MVESLIAGAAAGIIGCLGGQGMTLLLQKNNSDGLAKRVAELESRELVLKNDPDFISKDDVQAALTGTAQVMQQALKDQGQALMALIQQASEETAKAVRVAEARSQAAAPMQQSMSPTQMQAMYQQVEELKRQIGG